MRMSAPTWARRRYFCRRAALLVTLGLLGAAAAMAEPRPASPAIPKAHFSLSQEALAQRALQVPVGGKFRLVGVPIEARTVALALERFDVFTPDALVEVHEPGGARLVAPPQRAWFRGTVAEEPESLVFLAAGAGSVHGLILSRERLHVFGGEPETASLRESMVVRAFEETAAKTRSRPWTCELDKITSAGGEEDLRALFDQSLEVVTAPATAQYSVTISVETDYEFYAMWGSVDAAASYAGDLFGAISTIYHRDVATTLRINRLSLWTGGASSDPWTATTSGTALCQVGGWWATNRPKAQYPRSLVHFLSSKNLGGGIAWLNVVCADNFSHSYCSTGMGGGYGVTGNIDGSFNPSFPTSVWDIVATAHEIGHNFSSPHSHCYAGYPSAGFTEVDRCWGTEGGCYSGSTGLPVGGQGSIMSYCHQIGGMSVIALSFGSAGLYGTQSERIPQRMKNYIGGLSSSCRRVLDAPPADFNGDGRSDVTIYRNGAWLEFPAWPQN